MLRSPLISVLLLLALLTSLSNAHPIYFVYAELDIQGDTLISDFSLIIPEFGQDLGLEPNPQTGRFEREQLLQNRERMFNYIQDRIDIHFDYFEAELLSHDIAFSENELGERIIHLIFRSPGIRSPRVLSISADLTNTVYPVFEFLGKVKFTERQRLIILSPQRSSFQINLHDEDPGLFLQIRAFLLLGIEHIFIGIDHIMFLLGLILIGGRFIELVKIVTSFTIAHSITLSLSALNVVTLPTALIESAIALSIVYIGVENFFIKSPDYRWIVTGIFGLAHGFGFANVLKNLALPTEGLVISLFSFNIGVEVGQVIIIALILPLIWLMLKTQWKRQIVWIASAVIVIFGATWFLERAFDLPVGIV
ncbi:hypothetical protein GWN26_07430 [Candidatus Saccharibacteria bacterium]|nr:hypothetical protein [Calditrichia bacterium]NIV98980.1 hypothetical protein [Candidatus Saccharibacteria bacterium]NIW79236.1 hypothetical protein [Calditrichia bacterium]